jgi:hypothetical protein
MQSLDNFKKWPWFQIIQCSQVLLQFYILTVFVEYVRLKAVNVQVTQKEKIADKRQRSVHNRQIMSQTFLPSKFSFLHYLHKHMTNVETV